MIAQHYREIARQTHVPLIIKIRLSTIFDLAAVDNIAGTNPSMTLSEDETAKVKQVLIKLELLLKEHGSDFALAC